jgi:dTMP kinase
MSIDTNVAADTVRPGRFITVEGVDGAGKSSHLLAMRELIASHGIEVVSTREPGGTPLGEALRELLLHHDMHLETETLLIFAARREHLAQVIEPALARGAWVLCDRFTDATRAYQGGGRGLSLERIEALAQWVHPNREPDRTYLFDVPLTVARERLSRDRAQLDRFEREGDGFFERTRAVYRQRAGASRFCVIDATRSLDEVRQTVLTDLQACLRAWHG